MLVLMQRVVAGNNQLVAMWLACLLAACSGQGVDLEVTSEVPIDRVELFIANDHCYKEDGTLCDGVAWETLQPRAPGDVYVMKGDENIVATTRFDGERAVMHLEATAEFREPKYLALIGFKGDTAVSYALMAQPRIPSNSAETWRIELRYALPATTSTTVPPAPGERYERVHAWKRERVDNADELSRCLALQFWEEDKREWGGLFIVPKSDPDCDGRLVECDPLHANFNVGGGPTSCVATRTNLAGAPCVLGAAICEDGVSKATGCVSPPTSYLCVPEEICHVCSDDAGLDGCSATAIKSNTDVSGVACTFSGSDAGTTCGQGAYGSFAQINLPVACAAVDVRAVGMPFTSSGPSNVATVGGATITVTSDGNATGGCAIDLHWTTGTAAIGETATFVFLVKGSTTQNTLALPVRISMDGNVANCSTATTEPRPCMASPSLSTDSMLGCLQP
jgi:hypothetical protein